MRKIILFLATLSMGINHACKEPIEILIFRAPEDSMGNTTITNNNGSSVTIDIPNVGSAEEITPHFIIIFQDGILAIDRYEGVREKDQVSIGYINILPDNNKAILVGDFGTTLPIAIEQLHEIFPQIQILGFEEVNGGIDMYAIAEAMMKIRDYHYGTMAISQSRILSAGVSLFMAGKFRYAEDGAKLGVHDVAGASNSELISNDNSQLAQLKTAYKEMGIHHDFFGFMRSIPHNEMYFLSQEEMKKYHITNTTTAEHFEESVSRDSSN